MKTCKSCIDNDDGLCNRRGILVEDEDHCDRHREVEKPKMKKREKKQDITPELALAAYNTLIQFCRGQPASADGTCDNCILYQHCPGITNLLPEEWKEVHGLMFSIHLCCRISQECGPEFFIAFRIYPCCFDRNVVHSAQIAVIPEFSGVRTKFMIICLWPFSFFQVSPCDLSYDHLFACACHDLFFIHESIQSVYFFYLHVSDHCSVVLISLCNKAVHPMPPYTMPILLISTRLLLV